MTEQQRPGDQTGQDVDRYPGAPSGQQHPQAAVPPHQGWTGQQQHPYAGQHPYPGQQQTYPGQQPTGQHWTGTQQAPPVFTPAAGPAAGPAAPRRSRGWRIAVA
ncbi:hypothetical protein NH342_21140, partial [Klenkia sp. PcliD-1-E]|nr:hypothetical protein [Klenkia sp. PcliD-1-E]